MKGAGPSKSTTNLGEAIHAIPNRPYLRLKSSEIQSQDVVPDADPSSASDPAPPKVRLNHMVCYRFEIKKKLGFTNPTLSTSRTAEIQANLNEKEEASRKPDTGEGGAERR